MNEEKPADFLEQEKTNDSDEDRLDHALTQMEALYRSRCVTPPAGTNVTVQEIEEEG